MPAVSKGLRRELARILGPEGLLDAPEDLHCYSFDMFARGLPQLVALPSSTEQAAKVMRVAREEGMPLTPRGAGSSLTGGPVPVSGGIALGFSRMNAILEICPQDRLARVQPGVVTDRLKHKAAEHKLLYAPDPTSAAYCTIGGNIATNASGAGGLKYGATRDALLGLTAVLGTAEVLVTGGRCHKSVAGFDFTHFLCGSEGQLAVVTEALVRLLPLPEATRTVLAHFRDVHEASEAVGEVLPAGLAPCCLELMDSGFLQAVQEVYGMEFPEGTGCALLAEVDGSLNSAYQQAEGLAALFRQRALDVRQARSEEERALLWKARKGGTAALAKSAPFMQTLDYAVPLSMLPRAVDMLQELAQRCQVRTVIIAHAGDGNLHPMCIFDPGNQEELRRFHDFEQHSCMEILAMGGTLSGEHGIGLEKLGHLERQLGDVGMNLSRRVKLAFDPDRLLNPGKESGGAA